MGVSDPIELTQSDLRLAHHATGQLKVYLTGLKFQINEILGKHAGVSEVVNSLERDLEILENTCVGGLSQSTPVQVWKSNFPILACALALYRRGFASDIESRRAWARTSELVNRLDAKKKELDHLLISDWYSEANVVPLPRLRNFVAPSPAPETVARARQMDDKFRILYSASELWTDLSRLRVECEERLVPLSVVFLDVDHLKTLNSALTETVVDTLVLPDIMRVVERAVYGHGFAYRHGGDEFVLLLPSSEERISQAILNRLQQDMADITWPQKESAITVSVGLCVVRPDSPATDREILHWAACAKREAKRTRGSISFATIGRSIKEPLFRLLSTTPTGT